MEGYQWGSRRGKEGENVQRISSINGRYKIDGEVKLRTVQNRQGNGEAKEFICMTHGHELRWENAGGREVQGGGE